MIYILGILLMTTVSLICLLGKDSQELFCQKYPCRVSHQLLVGTNYRQVQIIGTC